VVAALQAAGAAAVLIHGRTQEQRYNKAANWDLISRVAGAASVPIIGNGDVLTLFEVMWLRRTSSLLHPDRVQKVLMQ
jgi:tRNA-dihydrouridine synthase 3